MGAYIYFETSEAKAEEFNKIWAKEFENDTFFLTRKEIEKEVKDIQTNPDSSLKHLKDEIKTVEDWNKVFPICKTGFAQIKVSGYGEEDEPLLKKQIGFALKHKDYFESIRNVDYARDRFGIEVEGDNIINGEPEYDDPPVTFGDLPVADSKIYQALVEYNRPDLWQAFNAFKEYPGMDTWRELRCKNLPWGSGTVWQLVEKRAKEAGGQDYGMGGRYNETFPDFMEVNKALVESVMQAEEDIQAKEDTEENMSPNASF